jgi:SAM-dependent methyltransferase
MQPIDEEDRWLRIGAEQKATSVIQLAEGLGIRDVLEVGSGTGAILEELDRRGFADRYWACEPSEPLFARLAEKRIPRLVDCAATTLEHDTFDGKRFDLVILSHVLEHVLDPAGLLAAALQRADHAIVEVPIEGNFLGNFRAGLKRVLTGQPPIANAAGHVQFFSTRDVAKLAGWTGGRVLRSRLYFPLVGYRSAAASGFHPYRRSILGVHAIFGDAIMARLYYGHMAVLVGHVPPSEMDAFSHELFLRPA